MNIHRPGDMIFGTHETYILRAKIYFQKLKYGTISQYL